MTVVFLNFSEGASPHQIVRFSSWAVRVFSAHHLTRTALIRVFLFSYGFPRGVLRVMTMSITHVSNAIDFISNGVLLLYKQRTKSKFRLRIKFLKEQYYCFTLSSVHSRFPFFRGEGLRVVRGVTMIGWLMVKFKTLTKKSRSKVSDQRSMIY